MLLKIVLSSLLPVLSLSCKENVTSIESCEANPSEAQPITIARAPAIYRHRTDYGVDVSWPMHYPWLSQHDNDPTTIPIPEESEDVKIEPLDRKDIYSRYMEGCYDRYDQHTCEMHEKERVAQCLRQPQSMVNYTEYGYVKIRTPEKLFRLIKNFWDQNRHNASIEKWNYGNSYTNHWDSPNLMLSHDNDTLIGGGVDLTDKIYFAAENIIQDWTSKDLVTSSVYGIRIYEEGAILATHVDRLPLVSSAIINVDQDVDEPWPLEVIGRDGKAHNVTMLPGDMVLYESHSLLHGRPFPLQGRFMANIFIHYAPSDTILGRPPYVIEDSLEDRDRAKQYGDIQGSNNEDGSTKAHYAARELNLEKLETIAEYNKPMLFKQDNNGWSPLYEAIRAESLTLVMFLLYHGEDVFKTNSYDETPFDLAEYYEFNLIADLLARIVFETRLGLNTLAGMCIE